MNDTIPATKENVVSFIWPYIFINWQQAVSAPKSSNYLMLFNWLCGKQPQTSALIEAVSKNIEGVKC
jgi:hypothetical protein